jgi:hypothetical protein
MDIVQIPLSQGKVALVDSADYERLQQYQWHAVERLPNWYAGSIAARPLGYYMHRVIMQPNPGEHVDHRNGDGLDNRRVNLRICTNAENRRNMRIRRGVSSYKGVWRNPNSPGRPWFAYIDFDRRRRGLGSYPTEIEAARAYNAATLELHRDFACLNIIEGLTYEESIVPPVRNRKPGRPFRRACATVG